MTLLADVAKASSRLVVKEPFLGHLLVRSIKTPHETKTGLALVQQHLVLQIAPTHWPADERQQGGLLKHQLLHLIFRHPFRARGYADVVRYAMAADLVVQPLLHPTVRCRHPLMWVITADGETRTQALQGRVIRLR